MQDNKDTYVTPIGVKCASTVLALILLSAFVYLGSELTKAEVADPVTSFLAAQTELTKKKRKCLLEKQPDFWGKVPMRDGGYAYRFRQVTELSLVLGTPNDKCGSDETYFLPPGEVSIHNSCLNAQPKSVLKGDSLSDKQRQTFADIETCEALTLPITPESQKDIEKCASDVLQAKVTVSGGFPVLNFSVPTALASNQASVYTLQAAQAKNTLKGQSDMVWNRVPVVPYEQIGDILSACAQRVKLEALSAQ